MKQLKYKVLLSDIDGTLIPYDYNSLPSHRVIESIKKAQKEVDVCLVTGRSYGSIKHLLEKLEIKRGYAVINNGANVIDISSKKILYDKPINKSDVKKIINILNNEKLPFYLKETFEDIGMIKGVYKGKEMPEKVYMFYTEDNMKVEKIDDLIKKLSAIPSISIHKSQHRFPNKYGLNITNNKATKLHGVAIIKKYLNIPTKKIIGIGDGYNDFPLLMACGLKVAMGNAVPELKEIADYIAPSVNEDGLAHVIEKFILNEK